jgi:hypothetical protein
MVGGIDGNGGEITREPVKAKVAFPKASPKGDQASKPARVGRMLQRAPQVRLRTKERRPVQESELQVVALICGTIL